ncbi:isoprenylcysteine carboxylmethyltransferase family protein [Aequorivita todarodis]|uniref:methyltransferase family protein n=1 Tax=Aequorivita todarodis TaxID=2036821 RepID=UPI0023501273|nr:isoprenylcysteine carboxylmethyltransferase family protein [Aequorivita todarodis]MDC8001212.1 isoprenylcysteine carboxylmethyltransferase family protein [Aequorivita todarodis]
MEQAKIALHLAWLVFLIVWIIGALQTKKTDKQEPLLKRFLWYWFPLIIAGLLLGPTEWFMGMWIRENFVEHTNLVGIIGASIAWLGTLLACWSRFSLGKNWSVSVQLKKDHELITTGPYKIIRHPIYTAILLLFIGNTLIVGDYRAILAILIVFFSLWRKLKLEEQWLTEHFGKTYIDYKAKTKALFPWVL